MKAAQRKEACMSPQGMALKTEATRGAGKPHEPGQAVFKAILPEGIDWKPFAAFPPEVRIVVLVGQRSEDGPYKQNSSEV
jgi:hypothetical protein